MIDRRNQMLSHSLCICASHHMAGLNSPPRLLRTISSCLFGESFCHVTFTFGAKPHSEAVCGFHPAEKGKTPSKGGVADQCGLLRHRDLIGGSACVSDSTVGPQSLLLTRCSSNGVWLRKRRGTLSAFLSIAFCTLGLHRGQTLRGRRGEALGGISRLVAPRRGHDTRGGKNAGAVSRKRARFTTSQHQSGGGWLVLQKSKHKILAGAIPTQRT